MTSQSSPAVALEPCPFCGGEAKVLRRGGRFGVKCTCAGTRFVHTYGTTEAEAIAAWNRRAAPRTPAVTGEVERLKADLKDEINFDLNTRINKVPESVVDQVVDLLAERGLLALAAPPPSSGWEAGAEAMREKAEETLRKLSRDAEMTAGVSPERVVNAAFIIKAEVLWSAANAVMDTPLPPPPSKEGV